MDWYLVGPWLDDRTWYRWISSRLWYPWCVYRYEVAAYLSYYIFYTFDIFYDISIQSSFFMNCLMVIRKRLEVSYVPWYTFTCVIILINVFKNRISAALKLVLVIALIYVFTSRFVLFPIVSPIRHWFCLCNGTVIWHIIMLAVTLCFLLSFFIRLFCIKLHVYWGPVSCEAILSSCYVKSLSR